MTKSSLLGTIFAAVAVLTVGGFWFGLTGVAALSTIFHAWGWLWIPLTIAAILAFVGLAPGRSRYLLPAAGIAIGLLAWGEAGQPYALASGYEATVVSVEEETSYLDRAPWNVADSYAARGLGDLVGEKQPVKAVHDTTTEDTTRYALLVEARSMFGNAGYEAVQEMRLPMSGHIPASATTSCGFDPSHGLKLDAVWPWRSLNRAIHNTKPGAHWNSGDAYAYCDPDGVPVVVVPLFKYVGWPVALMEPDGAMIYTGGQVRHLDADELNTEGIEGPTFPQSIATLLRDSLVASGSYGDWISSRAGYDTTEKDAEDANAGNVSEFTVVSTSGELTYVTPLTPRGSSESITALFEAPARQGAGAARVNTFPDLPSTSTLETTIRESSVRGDQDWATRWSAGMRVYEILPAADGHWVASIGLGQAVSYRADIAPDGIVHVVRVDDTAPDIDTSDDVPDDMPGVVVDGGKALSDMTDEELLDLIRAAVDELESR